jgi:cytochrome c oxidase assembly protein subunit 15
MPLRLPRIDPPTYRRITFVAGVLLAIIIVTGGAVRLSGSGLGCPEWPNCSPGHLVPRHASDVNAMIEFLNRVFTGAVSIGVIVAVLGALRRVPRRRDLVLMSLGLVAGVFAQAILGGLTVIFELRPELVMAHFLLSLVLLGNAIVLHRRASEPEGTPRSIVSTRVRRAGYAILGLSCVIFVTGTVVTASGPHGGDEKAKRFAFDIPEVARVHGIAVTLFLIAVVTTLVYLWRSNGPPDPRRRLALVLVVSCAQAAIGYIQYFNDIPAVLVGFHIAGATAVFASTLHFVLGLTTREPGPAGSASLPATAKPAMLGT